MTDVYERIGGNPSDAATTTYRIQDGDSEIVTTKASIAEQYSRSGCRVTATIE
jgi:hypothetical protein